MAASVGAGHDSGWTFFQANGFLNYGDTIADDPAIDGFGWMPFIAVIAADGLGMAFGGIVPLLFASAAVLWLANDLPPFITTSSRILFAMSFDRALPEAFAKVDERWHSPTVAILFCAIVAVFGAFAESGVFGTKEGAINIPVLDQILGNGITATDLLDGIFFTMACLAAILLPRKLKDVYDRTAWRPKIAGMEAVVVIGVIALIANIYLDLVILGEFDILVPLEGMEAIPLLGAMPIVPSVDGFIPTDTSSIEGIMDTFNWGFYTVLVLVVIGIVIYLYMKSYYTKKGVDFSTIYASIPPE
jgi:amino acid transporter